MSAEAVTKKAYTLAEAADAAGTSVPVLRRFIAKNDLTTRYIGHKPVILADELDAWLEALPTEAPTK